MPTDLLCSPSKRSRTAAVVAGSAVVGTVLAAAGTAASQPAPPAAGLDARLRALEQRVSALESVSFRRNGAIYELSVHGTSFIVGPRGDVTILSAKEIMLKSQSGTTVKLGRKLDVETGQSNVAAFGEPKKADGACAPPYRISAAGIRYVKPECL